MVSIEHDPCTTPGNRHIVRGLTGDDLRLLREALTIFHNRASCGEHYNPEDEERIRALLTQLEMFVPCLDGKENGISLH